MIEILVRMRESSGLSQSELARRMGRGQPYVWKIEHAQQRIDIVEVLEYAEITGHDFMNVMAEFHEAVRRNRRSSK